MTILCTGTINSHVAIPSSDGSSVIVLEEISNVPIRLRQENNQQGSQMVAATTENSLLAGTNLSRLLLTVPYYVYEDMLWINATVGGVPILDHIQQSNHRKHSNDYWFARASLEHPQRTMDPTKAKLFVIPLFLNLYCERIYYGPNAVSICHSSSGICDRDLLVQAARALNASQWYHQYPDRHIVTISHYAYERNKKELKIPALLRHLLSQVHHITHEDKKFNSKDRWSVPSYLVGRGCDPLEFSQKQYTAAMIATRIPKNWRFQNREDICQWMMEGQYRQQQQQLQLQLQTPMTMPFCGSGDQCPALSQAKFGFHVRGGSFGSQRLMDTILSGTIPIFTRQEQLDVLPKWINWTKLSYLIDLRGDGNHERNPKPSKRYMTQNEFLSAMVEIESDTNGVEERLQSIREHIPLFDWTTTLYPFDTYIYMLAAHLFPESISGHTDGPWPALILPKRAFGI